MTRSSGFLDIHCHLLPGLDDGARTVEESLEFCRLAAKDGIEVTFATPHVRQETYFPSMETIRAEVQRLRVAVAEAGLRHDIVLGGEVHIHPDLLHWLETGAVPTLADGGKYLLLEFPRTLPDYLAEESVESLRGRGYVPVIAHPERIDSLVHRPELLYRLVRSGALSQITAGSLEGTFGRGARQAARLFLEAGLVHFLGSDAHSTRRRRPVLSGGYRAARSLIGEEAARRLVVDHPRAVLKGEEIQAEEPREPNARGGWLGRLFRN